MSGDWNPLEAPCDYVLLGGKKSPGIADVEGASSIRRWDERDGYGISGSFPVFKGLGLAHFTVKLRLYSLQDWADWHAWKAVVKKLPRRRFGGSGKDSGAIDIWHPTLEEVDIKAVCAAEVLAPVQTDHGEWTVELRFLEWRRPKLSLAKPEGAAAEELDPVEEKIIKPLTEQFNQLATEGE